MVLKVKRISFLVNRIAFISDNWSIQTILAAAATTTTPRGRGRGRPRGRKASRVVSDEEDVSKDQPELEEIENAADEKSQDNSVATPIETVDEKENEIHPPTSNAHSSKRPPFTRYV